MMQTEGKKLLSFEVDLKNACIKFAYLCTYVLISGVYKGTTAKYLTKYLEQCNVRASTLPRL